MNMSTYEISVDHEFDAMHSVKLASGIFEKSHNHTWRVTLTLRSDKLDSSGMIADFEEVKKALRAETKDIEGSDLNAIPQFFDAGASAELVAQLLAGRFQKRYPKNLYCVRVTESPGCSAASFP